MPKEKRTKVEERSKQGILIGYEGTSNYRIYDPTTGRVEVTRSVTIDEKSLYDKDQNTHNLPLVDEWRDEDTDEFADPDKGDPDLTSTYAPTAPQAPTLPSYPTPASTPPPEERGGDADQVGAINGRGGTSTITNSQRSSGSEDIQGTPERNDIPSGSGALQDDEDEDLLSHQPHLQPTFNVEPRRSRRTRSPVKYGVPNQFGDECYDPSKRIPKANITMAANTSTISKSSVPMSHEHMVKVLTMLLNDIDNAGDDEPRTL